MMRRSGGGSVVNIITMASHGGEPVLTRLLQLEGRARDRSPERRLPVAARSHPRQRTEHRLDRDRGRGREQIATGQPADWLAAADAGRRSAGS